MTLEELYRLNRDLYVKKYTMKTGSVEDAEDIVQEAFMVALEYFDSYDETKAELSVWFSTVLHNSWRKYQREKRDAGVVRVDINEAEDFVYNTVPVEDKVLVEKLMNRLPEVRKEVVRLHYILGYSPREIEKLVDVKNSSIRVYLSEFRKEVGEMFN